MWLFIIATLAAVAGQVVSGLPTIIGPNPVGPVSAVAMKVLAPGTDAHNKSVVILPGLSTNILGILPFSYDENQTKPVVTVAIPIHAYGKLKFILKVSTQGDRWVTATAPQGVKQYSLEVLTSFSASKPDIMHFCANGQDCIADDWTKTDVGKDELVRLSSVDGQWKLARVPDSKGLALKWVANGESVDGFVQDVDVTFFDAYEKYRAHPLFPPAHGN